MSNQEIHLPDIGTKDAVDIIEVTVKVGDSVEKDGTLIVLESDKATMEIPSPEAGVVKELKVKVGDSIKTGDVVLVMETSAATSSAPPEKPAAKVDSEKPAATPATKATAPASTPASASKTQTISKEIKLPDIGTKDAVDIIEVSVKQGDRVEKDGTLIVLESDKATMEIPSPEAGVVETLKVKVGDSVSTGSVILTLIVTESVGADVAQEVPSVAPASAQVVPSQESPTPVTLHAEPAQRSTQEAAIVKPSREVHAGPAVRRLARELGADLGLVLGTGPRNRILKEDVHAWVKQRLSASVVAASEVRGSGLPELPEIDFSAFGDTETQELSRINRLSATYLHRAWVHIPHVTQFDEADITDLEAFRKVEAAALKASGTRLTILAFLVKAVVKSLKQFPRFNSSLSKDGNTLILKKYYHIGIAVDTPNGLVVPVIRNADQKSLLEIAQEMQEISAKARDKKLQPADMQGGCFSISSLGGIGGTAFTPIVNWPEVSILGVSKMAEKPQWNGKKFKPRLMLPLSLSYDHRVIDGAEAARFITHLSQTLGDIRRLLL
ncbi:pyruvate dehydrogenase, E2 component [gamma proteobacterium HdN1]|nr:pyruvate dehydrogenase, E2 component [gamma proteobacterium HdN1]